MRRRLRCACAAAALAAVATAQEAPPPVSYIGDGSPQALATLGACAAAAAELADAGWRVPATVVYAGVNPFDATRPPATLALAADAAPADNAFLFTASIVRRALAPAGRGVPVDALAAAVAAHQAPADAALRRAWEREWLRRVGGGNVLATVVPELLWRHGGAAAIRAAAAGPWPDAALDALRENGCDDPLAAAAEVAVAAVLQPAALGFSDAAGARSWVRAVPGGAQVQLAAAGVRFVPLPVGAGAIGVELLRGDGAVATAALRYSLSGGVDAVRLEEGRELPLPLQGVEWAALVVVALTPDAGVSLNLRALADFPQRVTRWDFVAAEGAATLAWETESHAGLAAYVVQALERSESGEWSVKSSELIPVAAGGDRPFGYAFVAGADDGAAAYRLLALTDDGLLAEITTFPAP